MIKLSIPFTRDNKILSLVKEKHLSHVEEVYMPLPASVVESCRPMLLKEQDVYEGVFEDEIKKAKGMGLKVSLIANHQFIETDKLRSTSMRIVKLLERLKKEYDIDKVVLSNLYIIRQYGEYIKNLGIDIELSIVINANTPEAVEHLMAVTGDYVSGICLGDAMIHNIDGIAYLKEKYPDKKLKVIAAHGCLVNCASSCQHHHYSCSTEDAQSTDPIVISERNEKALAGSVTAMCHSIVNNTLADASFIRPEDVYVYDGLIDTLKISGRQHSAEYIINVIDAYCNGEYDGKLQDLMDMGVNVDHEIQNGSIPKDFGKKRSNCLHQCYKCNYCKIISDFSKSHTIKGGIEV